MVKNPIFTICKKYDFVLNHKSLCDLYLPIIGNISFNIYTFLFNHAQHINQTGIKFFNLLEEIKVLGIGLEEFEKARKLLEAMNLIHTYYDETSQKYWLELIEPLNFLSFIENQKYRSLLISKIGSANYEKLEYIYTNNHFPQNVVDISTNFKQVFSDEQINSIYQFNFQNLYENLAKKTHNNIIMSNSVKQLIESYFTNFSLTTSEIEHCIFGSILHTSDNAWVVDEDLLNISFKKYINQVNNVNTFKQLKINRNAKLFYEQLPDDEKNLIFNSYKSLNPEQYYSAIKKVPLDEMEKSTIKLLREKYALDDSLINLMIDFSLNKTFGHFNRKYLLKMAETANNLNLLDIGNLLAFITKKGNPSVTTIDDHANEKKQVVNDSNLVNNDQQLFFKDDDGTHEWWIQNHYDMSPKTCIDLKKFPKWIINCPELSKAFLSQDDELINTPNLIDFDNNL